MTAVLGRLSHHSCPPPGPHLQCSWARSGPAHTSHRPFRGSLRGSGTPHCPGACLDTARGPSTHHPDPPGTAHTVCRRSQGSSQAPVGGGTRRGPAQARTDVRGQGNGGGGGKGILGPQSHRGNGPSVRPREMETAFYKPLHGRGEETDSRTERPHRTPRRGAEPAPLLPPGLGCWCQF